MKKSLLAIATLVLGMYGTNALAQDIAITCREGRKDEFTFTAGYPGFTGWALEMANSNERYNASNARFLGGRDDRNFSITFAGSRYEFKVLGKTPWVLCEGANVIVSKPGKISQYLHCGCDVD